MTTATPVRFTRTAVVLHWLLAVALLGSFCVGLYMDDLPLSPARIRLFNWHKWAGICILALSLVRLLWRLSNPPPPDLPMRPWQRVAARLSHRSMYVLFFAVPLVGWAYTSAAGFPVVLFGVLPLPDFVEKSKPLADVLKAAHATLAFALAGVAVLHVLGAIKHQWIDRDGLFSRMGFGGRSRAEPARPGSTESASLPAQPPNRRLEESRS